MSDELILYTNPMSRGRIARWLLEESGQPYRTEVVEYDRMRDPAFLAINPMGKVPVLRHGQAVVTENGAICAYVADAFPNSGLAPAPGDPARGLYYRWLFFACGPFEAAVTVKSAGWAEDPSKRRSYGWGSYGETLKVVEDWLETNDFAAGQSFTGADVILGSQIIWGLLFGTVEKRPAFERYANRLTDRAAYLRAKTADDALMPKAP